MSRSRIVLTLVTVTIGMTLALLWIGFGEDITIAYHRHYMKSAWSKVMEYGPHDSKQSKALESYDHHKAALVNLGFLERVEFPLQYISVPSLESRRLWEELKAVFPHSRSVMQGYEEETEDMIIVYDCPENIGGWEAIIRAYDQPDSQGIVKDIGNLLPFAGTWGDENNIVYYIISLDPDGVVQISTPPNDTWKTELKNIRLDGDRLLFDQYQHTPASGELKTITNESGEHPFSGVRCQIVLELDSANSDRIIFSLKTIHAKEPLVETLRRLKTTKDKQ